MSAGSAPLRRRKRRESPLEWALVHAALVVVIFFFGAPFLWIIASAFDKAPDSNIPWPRQPSLDNFRFVFDQLDGGIALRNSLIVSTSTMILATVTVSLAGYALSRLSFKRKTWLAYSVLLLQTMPLSATMVPIYDLARRLKLYDTYQGLILAHTAVSLPFLVWLMKGFYDAVPRYLEEAAWLDGRSKLRAWCEVLLPQTKPGIAVVAGFAFANAWAEVLMVIILVQSAGKATIPLRFFYAADGGEAVQIAAALAVLYILPVLLLFLALRPLMVRGLISSTRGL